MAKKLIDFIAARMGAEFDESKLIVALKKEPMTVEGIAKHFDVPFQLVRDTIDNLKQKKVLLEEKDGEYWVNEVPMEGAKVMLNPAMWQGDTLRYGFTADNHLGSHFERLDVLNLLYDLFEAEEIPVVFNGGNWIDGEASFNKNEIHTRGFGRQLAYAVQNYPFREGIETWFISGDDHEGWYNQREGINTGELFQLYREQAGLYDLKHLGYVEADIELNAGKFENPMWCRIMHPGGGSAYAVSYAPQKIIESLQPGEKPHILMVAHYHKMSYNIIRGVHTIQMATTQDQSIFMRKRKIEAHVGGGIVEFRRSLDGIINRCKVEFITAFDKKFYAGKDKYWKGL